MKDIVVEGHSFQIVTEQTGNAWRVEVVNSAKSAFAFDPTLEREEDAIAHASDALRGTDISNFLG
jgi:hypothetical protein